MDCRFSAAQSAVAAAASLTLDQTTGHLQVLTAFPASMRGLRTERRCHPCRQAAPDRAATSGNTVIWSRDWR